MAREVAPEGRALQWKDLSAGGRRVVSENIREAGQNISTLATQHVEGLARSKKATPGKVATAEGVASMVEPRNVTLQTAANRRQELYNGGMDDRAEANPHDPHQVIPTGAGWYFEHHRAIRDAAVRHGQDTDRAIAASGVMSPMNSPDNERAAVSAMMDAKANHKVHVTQEISDHLSRNGIDVSQHVGTTQHIRDLPTGTLTHLSDKKIAGKVDTGADLGQVARGGTRENMIRAEHVLDGNVHPDEAVNPHSAPKVWSYVHNTREAVPDSGLHQEYMGRIHQDASVRRGHISADQQALDLHGLGESHEGLLSPQGHSVEDTWMNAVSMDQPKKMVPGTKTSVMKAGGSLDTTYPVRGVKTRVNEETGKRESAHTDGRIKPSAVQHAWNNRATQKAAEQQGAQTGTTIPANAIQEVGWVQVRKEAGKDPAENERLRSAPKERDLHEGQGVFPGMEGLINDRRKR